MQSTPLKRHFGPTIFQPLPVQKQLGQLQIFFTKNTQANAFALGLRLAELDNQTVVASLFQPAQIEPVLFPMGQHHADHLGVKQLTGGQITRGQHQMAGAGNGKWRIVFGEGQCGHCDSLPGPWPRFRGIQ
ncbi:hypothetical protein D3C87_1570810 [compost metagenome]